MKMNTLMKYREGMTFHPVENHAPSSMQITDIHKLMLVTVNRFLLMTKEQLSDYLIRTLGLKGMYEQEICKEVQHLRQSNFLTACSFFDAEGVWLKNVYILGYRGRGCLKSMGEAPRMTSYLAQLDALAAMKILTANEYIIQKQISPADFLVSKTLVVRRKKSKKARIIVRPQGTIRTKEETRLTEAVRRAPDYLESIQEKLDRMQSVLDCKSLNMELSEPSVTLICEDDAMAEELRQCLQGKRYHFPVFATTDACVCKGDAGDETLLVRAAEEHFFERLCRHLFRAA